MKVKQEVKIYKPSEIYLDIDKEYGYKEVEKLNEVKGRCVIHIRSVKDTYASDEEYDLDGYCDAIFFKAEIYDCENKIVYKPDKLFDGIRTTNIDCQSRIYKDLSTMYIFDKPVKIEYWQCLEIMSL